MYALLLKDLYNLKKQFRILILFAVVYGAMSILSQNTSFLLGIFSVMSIMLPISSFSFDSYSKWDNYVLTLPLSRKQIIQSKYMLILSLLFFSLLLSVLLQGVAIFFTGKDLFDGEFFSIIIGSSTASMLWSSLSIPVVVKLGVEKARTAIFGFFLIPFFAVVVISKLNISLPSVETVITALKVAPIIAIIAMFISYKLSLKWYVQKEF